MLLFHSFVPLCILSSSCIIFRSSVDSSFLVLPANFVAFSFMVSLKLLALTSKGFFFQICFCCCCCFLVLFCFCCCCLFFVFVSFKYICHAFEFCVLILKDFCFFIVFSLANLLFILCASPYLSVITSCVGVSDHFAICHYSSLVTR